MTTQTGPETPARTRRPNLWIPRTPIARVLLALGLIAAVPAAFVSAANAFLAYPGCFDECAPRAAASLYPLSLAVLASPFLAVRVLHGGRPASESGRLAVGVALIGLLTAANWWAI